MMIFMKLKTFMKGMGLLIGLIIWIIVFNGSLGLISEKDTLTNVLGILYIPLFSYIIFLYSKLIIKL